MPDEPRSYAPTTPQANRAEQRGLGVGERDLEAAQDAGRPDGADQYDFDGADNPQEDGGDPSLGAQQGANHTRRPEKTGAEVGQGRKTRERNRQIVRGGLA